MFSIAEGGQTRKIRSAEHKYMNFNTPPPNYWYGWYHIYYHNIPQILTQFFAYQIFSIWS